MQQIELSFVDSKWLRYGNYESSHLWRYSEDTGLLLSVCNMVKRVGRLEDFLLVEDLECLKCKICLKKISVDEKNVI